MASQKLKVSVYQPDQVEERPDGIYRYTRLEVTSADLLRGIDPQSTSSPGTRPPDCGRDRRRR